MWCARALQKIFGSRHGREKGLAQNIGGPIVSFFLATWARSTRQMRQRTTHPPFPIVFVGWSAAIIADEFCQPLGLDLREQAPDACRWKHYRRIAAEN